MNRLIKRYFQEKQDLYADPRSYENTNLMDQELLSIANAIKSVYESLEKDKITPEDTEAYNWAVKEAAWKWR